MSSGINRLGSMASDWCLDFIGNSIDLQKVGEWFDFSDSGQVIFGYPTSPVTYATIFPTQTGCSHYDIRIFLFINTENFKVTDVSYSAIMLSPDGKGEDLEVELFEPDIEKAKELIHEVLE